MGTRKGPSEAEAAAGRAAVDAYIAAQTPAVAERLEVLRALIHEAAPGVTEKMTYRMPTFVLNGNLMYFAGCARHVGLYPLPQGVTAFTDRLQELGLAFSKGAIQLPHDRPLPLDLVRDIVVYRVAQQQK